jgi:RimJ/RimL family protein N-acetyltransferase
MIRQLTSEDWPLWKSIRLEALEKVPEAFGSSFEDEISRSDADWQDSLAKSDIFGVFQGNELVGTAGIFYHQQTKLQHKAGLFGVYIQPRCRGLGLAGKLIAIVIEHAKTKALQLYCAVVVGNVSALKLYQHHGFVQIGIEPRALKVGERFYDEILMVRKLDGK